MICNFYDIRLEDNDYIDYINYKNNSNYDRVISIATDVINKDIQREGHGRDFSWWTVSYRMYLKIAVLGELENSDKFYTINEIKELIKNGKIYPIDWYVLECDDRLYENRCKNDIDYLVKCEYGRKDGQISINDEYFDYFIDVREHGKVVIDSKNVWYNFLFAQLDGADVKAHGEVIMEYGSVYDNNTFCSYVDGADIEKHREVIRMKLLEEEQENKNNLKKVRKK